MSERDTGAPGAAEPTEPREPTAADEERLRLALTLIGDEAARADDWADVWADPRAATGTARARRTGRWHALPTRRRRAVSGALGAVAALSLGALLIFGADGADDEVPADSGRGQDRYEGIACSRLIADGDILAVRDGPEGRVVLTVAVREWVKPARGPGRVRVEVADPSANGSDEPWRPQRDVLLVVPVRPDLLAAAYDGGSRTSQLARMKRDLPRAERTSCPAYWRTVPDREPSPPGPTGP